MCLRLCLESIVSLTEDTSDFVVNQPGSSTTWINGSPYPVSWTMGLLDGIGTFDVEITRLSRGGVYLVATGRKLQFEYASDSFDGC